MEKVMPHPDYRIVDVSLRLDQVAALMHTIDDLVATGRGSASFWAGPMLGLLAAIPEDSSHLRPGPTHWLYEQVNAGRS
jgi:hypothetical protein